MTTAIYYKRTNFDESIDNSLMGDFVQPASDNVKSLFVSQNQRPVHVPHVVPENDENRCALGLAACATGPMPAQDNNERSRHPKNPNNGLNSTPVKLYIARVWAPAAPPFPACAFFFTFQKLQAPPKLSIPLSHANAHAGEGGIS